MLKSRPFVRMIIPLLMGIIIGDSFGEYLNIQYAKYISCFLFLIVVVLFFISNYRYKNSFGISINLLLLTFGICVSVPKHLEITSPNQTQVVVGTITDVPKLNERSVRIFLKCHKYKIDNDVYTTNENMIVYLAIDSLMNVAENDQIVLKFKPEMIDSAQNQYGFDYRTYWKRKGYLRQGYTRKGDYYIVKRGEHGVRKQIVGQWDDMFNKAGLDQQSKSVATALTIGDKTELSQDLKQLYSFSGTSHLLAVSGMHTAIIASILMISFGFLKKCKLTWIRDFLVIAGIWAYAWLVSFSPSVTRAALMFSLLLVGSSLTPENDTINNVAVSAFFLLLFNPDNLFNAGFQLSYMAVCSIILLFNPFRTLFPVKNKLLIFLRDLCLVSISAQFGTLCLTLFYFHQYPIYFLFSNLLAVPLTTLIVWGAVISMVSLPFPWLFSLVSPLFKWAVDFHIKIMQVTANLPYSVIENIPFSWYDLMFYGFIGVSLYMLIIKRKIRYLVYMASISVIWIATICVEHNINRDRELTLTYDNPKIVQVVKGNKQLVLYDTDELDRVKRSIQTATWSLKIIKTKFVKVDL